MHIFKNAILSIYECKIMMTFKISLEAIISLYISNSQSTYQFSKLFSLSNKTLIWIDSFFTTIFKYILMSPKLDWRLVKIVLNIIPYDNCFQLILCLIWNPILYHYQSIVIWQCKLCKSKESKLKKDYDNDELQFWKDKCKIRFLKEFLRQLIMFC